MIESPQWKQKLASFQKAMQRLDEAVQKETYTYLELAGLVQTFMSGGKGKRCLSALVAFV